MVVSNGEKWGVVLVVALSLVGSAGARAQEGVTRTVPQIRPSRAASGGQRRMTLQVALGSVAWNSAERGPIIAVAPDQVAPPLPQRDPNTGAFLRADPLVLPSPDERPLNIEGVAQYFGYKVVRLGTAVVLAPVKMTVMNDHLTPPDPTQGMDIDGKLRVLEATLSPSQWRLLGGQGLGWGDLTDEQRKIFTTLLPQPLRITHNTNPFPGRPNVFIPGDQPTVTLSDAERRGVRLRLSRTATLMLADPSGRGWGDRVQNTSTPEPGVAAKPTATLARDPSVKVISVGVGSSSYGQEIGGEVPSRLKPGELNFDAPAFAVDLSLAEVKTVGDAVKLLRDKTGVEIYADGRAAAFPLYLSDASVPVRASDLLKALCWGVTGTFRKVGPDSAGKIAFVLTDDLEGLGTRMARLERWQKAGEAQEREAGDRVMDRIRAQKPLQYLSFNLKDAFALSPQNIKEVEKQWETLEGRSHTTLPLGSLSPAQQEMVNEQIKKFYEQSKNDPSHPTVRQDAVQIYLSNQLTLITPGGDEVGVGLPLSPMSYMVPPIKRTGADDPATSAPFATPATMTRGSHLLALLPTTDSDREALFALAGQKGIRQVWLETDGGKTATDTIKQAIAAGKAHGVAVGVSLRLMQVPPSPANREAADRDILDETGAVWAKGVGSLPDRYPGDRAVAARTGNWLAPQNDHTLPILTQRFREVASIPGLAAVALTDTAVPGYQSALGDANMATINIGDFGYTPENRLAFLRANGYDPIDLLGRVPAAAYKLDFPYFNEPGRLSSRGLMMADFNLQEPKNHWASQRHDQQIALLRRLYSARAEFPALPVYLHNLGFGYDDSFVLWESADGIPQPPTRQGEGSRSTPARWHSLSHQAFVQFNVNGQAVNESSGGVEEMAPGSPERLAFMLRGWTGKPGANPLDSWDGVVLDIRTLPLKTALPLLQQALADPGKTGAIAGQ